MTLPEGRWYRYRSNGWWARIKCALTGGHDWTPKVAEDGVEILHCEPCHTVYHHGDQLPRMLKVHGRIMIENIHPS